MSIKNPTPATFTNATLLDMAVEQVNVSLRAGLSWLTTAYGKGERRERAKDTGRILYPAIYLGSGNEYLSMFPDRHLGQYLWWDIEDGQTMDWKKFQLTFHDVRFGLVLWGDFRNVYPADYQTRTIEHIKKEVLTVLNTKAWANVSLVVDRVFERSENVYRGYSIAEIDNQFEMRPYFALRFEGRMRYSIPCQV